MIFPVVPGLTTLVVRMVIGLFPPAGGGASLSQAPHENDSSSGVCVRVLYLRPPAVLTLGWSL